MRTVKIVEVGPRDGLQNEQINLDVDTRVEFINLLSVTGLNNIEIGSFVSPNWVPQMANTSEVLAGLKISNYSKINYSALVPNLQGLEQLFHKKCSTDLGSIAVFTAASETFCKKNINCTIAESLERFKSVIKLSLEHDKPIRGYISCVLGCPYEGKIKPEIVTKIAKELLDMGCYEISLGDTIGVGTILQVQNLISHVSKEVSVNKLAVHFHDTYGQALVNVYTALEMGVNTVDSAVAGLGGCPYAAGASGNLATEDLLYMLDGLNIKTSIDMNRLISAGHFICKKLNIIPRSKISLQRF
ncbi:MAG: hydroxymethylglutaryl-CoA lyase [Gammaproteobacteria bacterium]|nr:hydroxymethylglutaryl-CoA lyase [Gammaproteobacteria bacterium]